MPTRKTKTSQWPLLVKPAGNPNVSVAIRPLTQKNKGEPYTIFCLTWTVNGERKRRYHKQLEDAKKDAETVADSLAGKSPGLADLQPETRADISTAVVALRKSGLEKPLAAIVTEYAEVIKALKGLGTPLEAAKEYAERNAGLRQTSVPAAAEEWIDQEENNKEGRERSAWATKLRKTVQNRFAKDFTGTVAALDPLLIDKWFAGLKNVQKGTANYGKPLSETTKKNIRDDLASFFRWCQSHRYLPKDADLLEAVPEFQRKHQNGSKNTITPDDLAKLLKACPAELTPYVAVRAFAGLREIEASLLDWKHVHLETGWIEVTEDVAKQTADEQGVVRDIPIQPVLKAWLASFAKAEGPICSMNDPLQALPRLAKRAGVTLPRNALRHSYIAYRTAITGDVPRVADECGNSPEIIRKYYRRRGAQIHLDAPKWFAIMPETPANVVFVPRPDATAVA